MEIPNYFRIWIRIQTVWTGLWGGHFGGHFSGHFSGHFGGHFSGHFGGHFGDHFCGHFSGHFGGHFSLFWAKKIKLSFIVFKRDIMQLFSANAARFFLPWKVEKLPSKVAYFNFCFAVQYCKKLTNLQTQCMYISAIVVKVN